MPGKKKMEKRAVTVPKTNAKRITAYVLKMISFVGGNASALGISVRIIIERAFKWVVQLG